MCIVAAPAAAQQPIVLQWQTANLTESQYEPVWKQTIAEFVEEEETALMLREYGVDMAQGYHLGRPAALNGNGVAAPV